MTSYCTYPVEAAEKEIIGGPNNPNIEKIFSLSPDLVVGVSGINRTQVIEKLRDLGLEVVVFDACNTFDAVEKVLIELGKLTGKEEKTGEVMKEVKRTVRTVTEKLKNVPRVKVFWEVGARPLVSAGGKSFANEFIRRSGGVNIFADIPLEYPRVSREEVLRRNPEAIMLVTMGDVTEKEKLYWQEFGELAAVKNNRIYVIDADVVCRPGPASFLMGLVRVARALH
ncbi:unnamed protein product, partial [marine sediment metagenome]